MSEALRYRGKLQLSGNQRSQLVVDLRIQDGALILLSADESLGAWPVEDVTVSRISGDLFTIKLGIEEAVFVADDALAFSYEGLPAIEREAELLKDKRRLRKKRDKSVRRLLTERNGRRPQPPTTEPQARDEATVPVVTTPTQPDPYDDWLPPVPPTRITADAAAVTGRREPAPRPVEVAPKPVRAKTTQSVEVAAPTANPDRVKIPVEVVALAPAQPVRNRAKPSAPVEVPAKVVSRTAAGNATVKPEVVPVAEEKEVARTARAAEGRKTLPAAGKKNPKPVALLPTVAEVETFARERPASKKTVVTFAPAPPPVAGGEPAGPTAAKTSGIRLAEAAAPAQPVRSPAQRNWKHIDGSEPASTLAGTPAVQEPTADPAAPERLRKRAGQGGFSRQMETVQPSSEPATPTEEPLKKAWKRALAGGPVVAGGLREPEPVERISVAPSVDPFEPPVSNVAAYGIRSRPTGLSARLKRTKQAAEPHEHVWVQQTLAAGLVRRVCDDCGQVSLDLTEEEEAARLKA
jgi:hypothetical protein